MTPQEHINVLIVDDDPMVIEMMVGRLDGTQYEVIGRAANGRQAVALVKELKPDVVLMDIEMPEMNGIEASRLITETCPTPIVILTAYQHQKIVEEAGEAGAGAYLTKPPLLIEIERAITIAIARFKDMQQLRSLNLALEESNSKLQTALDDVETLSGMLPICSSCKKIRDDKGYWNQLEIYIEKHSDVLFSHGICPDCADNIYGDAPWYQKYKQNKSDSK
jgi:AmiR/NasT family two-component response regulator